MQLNLKGLQGFQDQFSVVPAGRYGVSVVTAKEGVSSASNPMIKLSFQIEEDPANNDKYVGRRVFSDIPLTPKTMGRVIDVLLALGFTREELDVENFELDLAELIGMTCVIDVEIRQLPGRDGLAPMDANNVKRYLPNSSKEGSSNNSIGQNSDWTEHEDDDEEVTGDLEFELDDLDEADPDSTTSNDTLELDKEEETTTEGEEVAGSAYAIPNYLKISAKARDLAIANQVEFPEDFTGTGPGGTVTVKDVQALIDG